MLHLLFNISSHKPTKKYYLRNAICLIVIATCIFFVSLWTLKLACDISVKNYVGDIIRATENPFVGLFIGLFATALAQSSSAIISVTIIFTSSGLMHLHHAVPIVMGANIGTTLTSSFFAISYLSHKKQFQKAVSAATLHDFFNLFTALILFPLEYYFQTISLVAQHLSQYTFKYIVTQNTSLIPNTHPSSFGWVNSFIYEQSYIPVIFSFFLVLVSLKIISLKLQNITLRNNDATLLKMMLKSNINSLLSGLFITSVVQSSSIITSVMIPWVVEKKISLKNLFPFLMGVNLGTTVTTFIVAIGQNEDAMSLAFVHGLFNFIGILLFFPRKPFRNIPLWCVKKLSECIWKNKLIGLMYILLIFFLIPYILIYISWD